MGNSVAAARATPVSATGVPVAGIGVSAGGAESVTRLLEKLPVDSGLALVLFAHPDLEEDGFASRLSRATRMPVHQVLRATRIQPNHIYLFPGNATPILSDSMLRPGHGAKAGAGPAPIDHFLRSLAEAHKNNAIGVVLSEAGFDGAAGLRAIQSQGGIAFAQDRGSNG